jgi:hypothetical protein
LCVPVFVRHDCTTRAIPPPLSFSCKASTPAR